jgi:dihydropyrimidinase
MNDLVIASGTVVTAAGAYRADIGIRGERVAAVGHGLAGLRTMDADGCYVIPGGVDVHVHLQMAVGGFVSSDTFASGSVAAACGGTTTLVDFVEPAVGQSMLQALALRRGEADPQVAVDYGLHMTLPVWQVDHALDELEQVMEQGVYSFKMYQAYGALCLDDARLYAALRAIRRGGGFPILHSENGPLIDVLRAEAQDQGHVAPVWHARTRPAALEAESIARALEIARLAGSPLYIVHVSCGPALEVLACAQREGRPVFGETCPQYLWLTEDHLGGPHGGRFVCSPPLRSAADQQALWIGLSRGVLGVVSTDHCPFTADEKDSPPAFTRIPGGLPSVEARLSLVFQAVRRGTLALSRWVDCCCSTPARLFGLAGKGELAPGYDADLVVFDPQKEMTISRGALHERVDWSPYDGMTLTGWPRAVYSRGELVAESGRFVSRTGRGRFLAAGLAPGATHLAARAQDWSGRGVEGY